MKLKGREENVGASDGGGWKKKRGGRGMVAMSSSLICLRFEPRLLRIFRHRLDASISCSLPLRWAGLRFDRIHTYVEIPVLKNMSVGRAMIASTRSFSST